METTNPLLMMAGIRVEHARARLAEALAALTDHTERLTSLSACAGVYNLADLERVANLSTLAAQAEGAKAKLVLELSVLNALKEAGVK